MCVRKDRTDRTSSEASADTLKSALVDELVTANRILFDQGVVDAFGHVSVRSPNTDTRFLLARNMAPGLVRAEDIMEFTLDGDPIDANDRKVYLERFIHGEIYREYPQAHAVVHSHSAAMVPLSIVKEQSLRAVFHMAGFIGERAPIFEIRDVAGSGTDLLISNRHLGQAFARSFGSSSIALMRGHGSTVMGHTLRQAVYRATYAEINARYQMQAMIVGDIVHLTAEEASSCKVSCEAQVDRAWDLWKSESEAKRL